MVDQHLEAHRISDAVDGHLHVDVQRHRVEQRRVAVHWPVQVRELGDDETLASLHLTPAGRCQDVVVVEDVARLPAAGGRPAPHHGIIVGVRVVVDAGDLIGAIDEDGIGPTRFQSANDDLVDRDMHRRRGGRDTRRIVFNHDSQWRRAAAGAIADGYADIEFEHILDADTAVVESRGQTHRVAAVGRDRDADHFAAIGAADQGGRSVPGPADRLAGGGQAGGRRAQADADRIVVRVRQQHGAAGDRTVAGIDGHTNRIGNTVGKAFLRDPDSRAGDRRSPIDIEHRDDQG